LLINNTSAAVVELVSWVEHSLIMHDTGGQNKSLAHALIRAIGMRVGRPGMPVNEKSQQYADCMRELYASYPNEPDIAALYAESLMCLRPWALWNSMS
jgi:hypothetical protein